MTNPFKAIKAIKAKLNERRRDRQRNQRTIYFVEDIAREDALHDEPAILTEDTSTIRWIDAEEGEAGVQYYAWRRDRARPLGKHHVRLARLKEELRQTLRLLAAAEVKAAGLRDKLNAQRLRWFQDGITKPQRLLIGGLVFIAEGIANYISFVMLPLPLVGQAVFAAIFTILLTVPAHYAGVLAIDAIFNWDHRDGENVVDRVHQKVILAVCLFLLAFLTVLTGALGFMRDAYFRALANLHPQGLFAAINPTALTVALLLGALAGVVAIILIAAKHQAGETRRVWTGELKLTEGERKELEQRAAALQEQIAEAEAKYDVVAEQHAADGLARRKRGVAIRAQYERAYANEQRALGRDPQTTGGEPDPDPDIYYEPIRPAHTDLPALPPVDEANAATNGTAPADETRRRLAHHNTNGGTP